MASRVSICSLALVLVALAPPIGVSASESESPEQFVLTLDHSNFSEVVSKHDFVVVEFYAPWCGHCKKLEPEYEKAAAELSSLVPKVVLAKVDANEEENKPLASQYDVNGFPTLKIIRNGGKAVQDYKGPREAKGIVEYLIKQSGPASTEIKSSEDASNLIVDKKVVIVGVFPELSGEEYENFTALAEKLRSEYEFGHTTDAKLLPRGESSVTGSFVRLFKPFDELFVDSKEFDKDALEKFVEKSSVPVVTVFNSDPTNHPFVIKFFNSPNAKAMLFMDFKTEHHELFKNKYAEVASEHRDDGISFLMGDLEASQGAFQYFGLKEEQIPLIIIQTNDGQKYLKPNVELDQLATWVKEFKDGKVQPFRKSEPIPAANNEPVKVVVADSLHDVVNSGKNVLIEFYAPWCGHCKKLAPILDEVALTFESDPNVIIAKFDATANDIPSNDFDVKGYPTLYFKSSAGNLSQYDGDRTKEDIIDFIKKNRGEAAPQDESAKDESVKDEL
ncbi:hypothetical protein QQ045_001066 [Rhodiola kirilowii]